MRHRVVHDYLHVDYELVWDVVTVEMQPLITVLERIVPRHIGQPGAAEKV